MLELMEGVDDQIASGEGECDKGLMMAVEDVL